MALLIEKTRKIFEFRKLSPSFYDAFLDLFMALTSSASWKRGFFPWLLSGGGTGRECLKEKEKAKVQLTD